MNILISNNVAWHYEIIESVIARYNEFFNIEKNESDKIFLKLSDGENKIMNDISFDMFLNYLKDKYKNIIVIDSDENLIFDYKIYCTAYPSDAKDTHRGVRPSDMAKDKNVAYISHLFNEEVLNIENVFFLSKFNNDLIPENRVFLLDKIQYSDVKIKTKIPTFIVQGSFTRSKFDLTRDYSILEDILSVDYGVNFIINIMGRWHENDFSISNFIDFKKVHPSNLNKIKILLNQDWDSFCFNFSKSDVIIPSISKENNPQYFNNEMTSTFIYSNSHDIITFACEDFKNIYKIDDKKYFIYEKSNIAKSFKDLLNKIYGDE